MDKYEYKIRSEEIRALIAKGEYAEAAALADSIDWRRVKSVMMLCTISDLYKINRRYEDARDMLLLAYDRHPGGRSIVYSLCELSIKMGEFVAAVEYYKEFVQVASKDSGRYVLQYKLYEAQEVSLEERITVLEELKSKDYTEKWAYELAYLYHQAGLGTRCAEECDELILWFGEGKYVLKALELKRLHKPLTEAQQEKYEIMKGIRRPAEEAEAETEEDPANAPTKVIPRQDLDIQVKLMNVGQYDTINIQKELAQNMKDLWEGSSAEELARAESEKALAAAEVVQEKEARQAVTEEIVGVDQQIISKEPAIEEAAVSKEPAIEEAAVSKEPAIEEAAVSKEPAIEEAAVSKEPAIEEAAVSKEPAIEEAAVSKEPVIEESAACEEPAESRETKVEEVFFGETGEIDLTGARILEQMKQETLAPEKTEEPQKSVLLESTEPVEEKLVSTQAGDLTEWHITPQLTKFDKILGMDYDGQISMVVPESEKIEKQITGQIRLEEVLIEWEKMKKDSEQKRMEAVRQRVMQQTGAMFTEFEESARDGLLEQLENGTVGAVDEVMVQEALITEADGPEELAGEEFVLGAAGAVVSDAGLAEAASPVTEAESADAEESDAFLTEADEVEELEEIENLTSEETEDFADEFEEDLTEEAEEDTQESETEEDEFAEEGEASETGEEFAEEAEASETGEEFAEEAEASETEEDEFAEEGEASETGEEFAEEAEASETGEEFAEEAEASETEEEEFAEEAEASETMKAEDTEAAEGKPVEQKSAGEETAGACAEKKKVRPMSYEEKQLFASYIQNKSTKEQIISAIDNITMAAYTGNVIISGEEGMDTMTLAKNLIKEVQQTDSNFSGKIAKISGASLNRKDVMEILDKLANGALIIQKAGALKKETADNLRNGLEQEGSGIIVVLEDTKKEIKKLLKNNEVLKECFTIRIDVEALDNDTLVAIAKEYAKEQEYSIDTMGVLALHTCIAERQTSDHAVTVAEVKEMVDEAIANANRKTLGHFFDILLAKRYDGEDMIVLREKDFI